MLISNPRLKNLWHWLAEARYAWLSAGVIFVSFIVALRPNTSEPVIRLTGLALQILGIATVIWGISETRAFFGQPSFAAKAKSWFSRFPLIRRNTIITADPALYVFAGEKIRVQQIHNCGSNPSNEERISSLEKNIKLIHQRITDTEKEMDEEDLKLSNALKNEERKRRSADDSLLKKLEVTGTGGVHISAIGASWLFVGVILSTAAPEIATLLK